MSLRPSIHTPTSLTSVVGVAEAHIKEDLGDLDEVWPPESFRSFLALIPATPKDLLDWSKYGNIDPGKYEHMVWIIYTQLTCQPHSHEFPLSCSYKASIKSDQCHPLCTSVENLHVAKSSRKKSRESICKPVIRKSLTKKKSPIGATLTMPQEKKLQRMHQSHDVSIQI